MVSSPGSGAHRRAGIRQLPAAQTATVPGTGECTGTVESSAPYNAAQVFIRNTDKRMLYMVYTNAGAVPRRRRSSPATTKSARRRSDLKSDVQKLAIKAGESPKVTLTLRAARRRAPTAPSSTRTRARARARRRIRARGELRRDSIRAGPGATSPSGPA